MVKRVLLVFATVSEAEVLRAFTGNCRSGSSFCVNETFFEILITGIGGVATAWSLKNRLCNGPAADLAINLGIAGSFSGDLRTGEVVMPVKDCFADLGIEIDGRFITLSEAGFLDKDSFPFIDGFIRCENRFSKSLGENIKKVNAITVNTATGSESSIEILKKLYNPDIETMEGASFFYICARENMPFLALRSISNMVEPVRKSWDIPLALKGLAGKVHELINGQIDG